MVTDVRLNNRSIKRPDASFKIRRWQIPVPPPVWLKLQRNGHPYPNLVVEVAVNHEGLQKLRDDMQRYFTRHTSIRVWIGVKY
jgi:Uma2 family endonuclease